MAEKHLYRLVNKGVITPEDFLMAGIFYIPGDETRHHLQVTDEKQVQARRHAIESSLLEIPRYNPHDIDILLLRTGLKDGQARSLKEVGKIVGLSKEGISQVENKILRSLRNPRLSDRLRAFLPNQTS